MVRRAREAQDKKAGVRFKARVPDALWARVRKCADGAAMAAEEWVCLACRAFMAGRFDGVAIDEKTLLGTREASAAQWVRAPEGMERERLREALLRAAAWHEPRLPRYTPQAGTENWVAGRDYLLEG